jgi:hypothetical protein
LVLINDALGRMLRAHTSLAELRVEEIGKIHRGLADMNFYHVLGLAQRFAAVFLPFAG